MDLIKASGRRSFTTCELGGRELRGGVGFVQNGLRWSRDQALIWIPLALFFFPEPRAQPSDLDTPWEAQTRLDEVGQDDGRS